MIREEGQEYPMYTKMNVNMYQLETETDMEQKEMVF